MPERAHSPLLYDFGAGPLAPVVAQAPPLVTPRAAIATRVQALPALDGTVVLYRLAYADAQQVRAYALARWTMPPGELVQQRLRARLSPLYAVLKPDEGGARILQIELEEFSQVFQSPTQSTGVLRLRATVLQPASAGDKRVVQRNLVVQRPAPSADAAGGVRALTAATDAAVDELVQWVQTLN